MRDATHHRIHGISDDRGAEWVLHQPGVWTAGRDLNDALAAPTAPRSEAVNVSGNHGRWIVGCPDCNSAQLAAPNDHRFMCCECANIAIDGLWRPVVWPKDPDKLATILNQRGAVDTRNYEPGETTAELRAQNEYLAAGGLPVDGRYVPGADTTDDVPGAASDHEGHTHRWPKQVKADGVYTCDGCGLEVTGLLLINDRKATA